MKQIDTSATIKSIYDSTLKVGGENQKLVFSLILCDGSGIEPEAYSRLSKQAQKVLKTFGKASELTFTPRDEGIEAVNSIIEDELKALKEVLGKEYDTNTGRAMKSGINKALTTIYNALEPVEKESGATPKTSGTKSASSHSESDYEDEMDEVKTTGVWSENTAAKALNHLLNSAVTGGYGEDLEDTIGLFEALLSEAKQHSTTWKKLLV